MTAVVNVGQQITQSFIDDLNSNFSGLTTAVNTAQATADGKVGTSGDASSTTVKATGSTTARSLADRFADIIHVDDCGAKGDNSTDDSVAFTTAFSKCNRVVCTPGKIYRVKDVSINGKVLELYGAVIEAASGAKYALQLTGFAPAILGGTIRDTDDNCVKLTTLASAASATDTTVTVADATGYESGQWIGFMLDSGYPFGTIITNVSGATITLQRAVPSAAASGNEVCASWGMVNINNCSRYQINDVLFVNSSAAIWNDRGAAGQTNTKGELSNVIIQDAKYLGIGIGRDVAEENRANVRIRGGRNRTQTATGDGTTTQYSTDRPIFLKTDLTVTVDGVASTAFTFVNSNTFAFNTAPASNAAISYSNFYHGWFGNFADEDGWTTIRGGDQWVNCESLQFFYGSYLYAKELMNFVNVIDDTCHTARKLYACSKLFHGLYFAGYSSRTIDVDGASAAIVFGGTLHTLPVPATDTVTGTNEGNITVGSGSDVLINMSSWTAESDQTISGSGAIKTPTLFSTASATAALAVNNDADSSNVTVATFGGNRATPTDFDTANIVLKMASDASTQFNCAAIAWQAADVNTGTGTDGVIIFRVNIAGTLTDIVRVDGTFLRPASNDGAALGSSGLSWSDLFLASGGVINWNNGAFTLTQSGSTLTASGALVSNSYVKSQSTTVASLPAASTAGAGARAFVTDATATTFLSTVAGGGTNKVPVVSDGASWKIG